MGYLPLLLAAVLCFTAVTAFKAAVYEHVQVTDPDGDRNKTVKENLKAYEIATQTASKEKADIIVFPEDGILFGFTDREEVSKWAEDVPEPGVVPCSGNHSTLLANLSCLALNNNIYLVANIIDKKPCSESEHGCPRDKTKFFNTNVAFDRNGTLVSRYHKNHLFIEPFMSPADSPEFAVFDTDFARVGMFICFDVFFAESSQLVEKHNVTLAVMSSWWFDGLPGWYSVAVQQAWSLHTRIPLLAAGIQRPDRGSLGSGIYAGVRGPLNYTYSPDGKSKLLFADPTTSTPDKPRYSGDVLEPTKRIVKTEDISDYASQELSAPSGDSRVCHGDFCCSLSYETSGLNDKFVLLAKHGRQRLANYMDFGLQTCVLAVCNSTDDQVCKSFPYKSSTKFSKLQLTGGFTTSAIFPVLASNELALTPKPMWRFESTENNEGTLTLDQEKGKDEPILEAVLYARLYELDRFVH